MQSLFIFFEHIVVVVINNEKHAFSVNLFPKQKTYHSNKLNVNIALVKMNEIICIKSTTVQAEFEIAKQYSIVNFTIVLD